MPVHSTCDARNPTRSADLLASPRIRVSKHHVYELLPAEWLDRYCDIGRWSDPLRMCEIVETRRIKGAKCRIARTAVHGRMADARFVWVLDRHIFDEETFASLEEARFAADYYLLSR
jgi:hypothetical protein